MRIDSPTFSGSISQGTIAYSNLSGSFTGSFNGIYGGFETLLVTNDAIIGSDNDVSLTVTGSVSVSGSINITDGSFSVNNVNVLDSAIAFAIALG